MTPYVLILSMYLSATNIGSVSLLDMPTVADCESARVGWTTPGINGWSIGHYPGEIWLISGYCATRDGKRVP